MKIGNNHACYNYWFYVCFGISLKITLLSIEQEEERKWMKERERDRERNLVKLRANDFDKKRLHLPGYPDKFVNIGSQVLFAFKVKNWKLFYVTSSLLLLWGRKRDYMRVSESFKYRRI